MLDTAIRCGLSHSDFWALSLREFSRIARLRQEQRKYTEELQWWHTATTVAYMTNTIGGAVAGRKWKVKQPKYYFDLWLKSGDSAIDERLARIRRGRERHKARLAREKARRAA